MKILSSKRARGVWGSASPKQLLRIGDFLKANGFEGPTQASAPNSLVFVRKIDNDLMFCCSINRVYEDPKGVFNFQSYLSLVSRELRADVVDSQMWEPSIVGTEDDPVYIFSVGLQHLKWNAEGGGDNPVWQVSELPEYEASADDWINAWMKYAAPIVSEITDVSSAIDFCRRTREYKKNPWVRSEGFVSSALDIYIAMLMVRNGQAEQAESLLVAAIAGSENHASKLQLETALGWAMRQKSLRLH